MRAFLLRVLVNAIAIAIVASILPGIHIVNDQIGTLLVVAFIFGIINALIKPLVKLLTCPLVLITMGLFSLVVNGLMLMLTASLSGGRLQVENFWWAMLAGLIIAVISVIMENLVGVDKKQKD